MYQYSTEVSNPCPSLVIYASLIGTQLFSIYDVEYDDEIYKEVEDDILDPYELYRRTHYDFKCFGMSDNFLFLNGLTKVHAQCRDEIVKPSEMTSKNFILIDEKFNEVIKLNSSNIYAFIYGMIHFERDFLENSFMNKCRKREEFIATFVLLNSLQDLHMTFNFQKEIDHYFIDLLASKNISEKFIIQNELSTEIPDICIAFEIDENNHDGYDEEKEKMKTNDIEFNTDKLFRIPIKRGMAYRNIELYILELLPQIKREINNIILANLPEVDTDELIKEVNVQNLNNFIRLFNKHGEPYPYTHAEIGGFLQYSDDRNYRNLRELVTSLITKNILQQEKHYILSDPKTISPGHPVEMQPKTSGRKQITYRFNRTGLYILCMSSDSRIGRQYRVAFAEVYEACMRLLMKHKIFLRNINIENKVKKEDVKKRILAKKNSNEKHEKITQMTIENSKLKLDISQKESIIQENAKKINNLQQQVNDFEFKISSLVYENETSGALISALINGKKINELKKNYDNAIEDTKNISMIYCERYEDCKQLNELENENEQLKVLIKQMEREKEDENSLKENVDYTIEVNETEVIVSYDNLNKFGIPTLREICKDYGIKILSKYRKHEIIDKMIDSLTK